MFSSPVDARTEEDQERIRQLEGKLAKVDELEKALLEMKQLVEGRQPATPAITQRLETREESRCS